MKYVPPFEESDLPLYWQDLFDELWVIVFSYTDDKDVQPLKLVNKWANNLYWKFKRSYILAHIAYNPEYSEKQTAFILKILCKAHPAYIESLELPCNFDATLICNFDFPCLNRLVLYSGENYAVKNICQSFPNIRTLYIIQFHLNTDTVAYVSHLTNLTSLCIRGYSKNVYDDCLISIGRLTKLRFLEINYNYKKLLELDDGSGINVAANNIHQLRNIIDTGSFSCISSLTNLEYLNLGNTVIATPKSIEIVSKLKKLQHLSFQQCQLLTNESIIYLGELTNLSSLVLYKANNISCWQPLLRLMKMEKLTITGSQLNSITLHKLVKLPKISWLSIFHSILITEVDIEYLKQKIDEDTNTEIKKITWNGGAEYRVWDGDKFIWLRGNGMKN